MNPGKQLSALVAAAGLALPMPAAERQSADIIVYGASASGVMAAVAAAREGKSVILLDAGRHVGGMVSGGLGATDAGRRNAIGGYPREFFDRIREYYVATYGANSPQLKFCSDGLPFRAARRGGDFCRDPARGQG